MPAFTTRLGLYKPGGGSTGLITPDEVVDIDKINGNFDKLDSSVGAPIYTSGTRPSTPFGGQLAKESDTENLIVWDTTANTWKPVGIPYCANSSVRDSFYPNPKQGNMCYRADLGAIQQYYALYDATTNPTGWRVAGWHAPLLGDWVPIDLAMSDFTGVTTGISVDSSGGVKLTAYPCTSGSSFNMIDVLWGLFDNYKIIFDGAWTAANYVNLDLLLKGTNAKPSGTYISWSSSTISAASITGNGPASASTLPVVPQAATDGADQEWKLFNPYKIGGRTSLMAEGHVGAQRVFSTAFDQSAGWATNQFSGLTINPAASTSSGTLTATFRLFGQNKAIA